MNRNRKTAIIGLGIALYAVLSAFIVIPIVNRIKLDLGYIVFGLFLNGLGISGTIVGVAGCIIGNMLKGGSFPFAWAIGQLFIGLSCGYLFPKVEKMYLKIIIAILAVFIGIGLIKTIIEIAIYHYPFILKFSSNMAAFGADVIPFVIGILLSKKISFDRFR